MAKESTLRFGAQTDEVTSLLRIVNMVRAGDASTRPEIGRVTGLGRGVVTQRVDQAIEMGYLEDGEFGPSSGGRAPRTLRFRSSRGRIIVCALGALHIHVGVAMLEGDILEQTHRAWDIARGPAETLDTALAMIDEVLARTPDVPGLGHLGRHPRARRFRVGPAGRAADHAGLERVRHPPTLRGALRRARLGRQRRQPARVERADRAAATSSST